MQLAIVVGVVRYLSAISSRQWFNSGYLSLPMKTPSKKPYWNGDQVWMVISLRRQNRECCRRGQFTGGCHVDFHAALDHGGVGQENCSWSVTRGWLIYFCSSLIWLDLWLETPVADLAALAAGLKASATSSGSIRASGAGQAHPDSQCADVSECRSTEDKMCSLEKSYITPETMPHLDCRRILSRIEGDMWIASANASSQVP